MDDVFFEGCNWVGDKVIFMEIEDVRMFSWCWSWWRCWGVEVVEFEFSVVGWFVWEFCFGNFVFCWVGEEVYDGVDYEIILFVEWFSVSWDGWDIWCIGCYGFGIVGVKMEFLVGRYVGDVWFLEEKVFFRNKSDVYFLFLIYICIYFFYFCGL